MAKRLDKSIDKKAVELYENGMNAPEIAERLGISSNTVYRRLDDAGIVPRTLVRTRKRTHASRRMTDEQELELSVKYKDGFSLAELGREYGVNLVTIRNALRRQGVDRRPKGNKTITFANDRLHEILELRESGLSQYKVGKKLGLSQPVVSRALRLAGYCSERASREDHANWKGGKIKIQGYVAVLIERGSPYFCMAHAGGYAMEHRLVMASIIGRPLEKHESVHHINGDRADNRPENLQLRSGRHGKGVNHICLNCGSHNIGQEKIRGV
jgi:predicted transcriptional regulator